MSVSPMQSVPAINSIEEVTAWLQGLGLSEYTKEFTENEIDGAILLTLSSEELRDDLSVANLHHRRIILEGIRQLAAQSRTMEAEHLPEHARILTHLSNVRTYHSWIRVGTSLLGFSVVTLRLAPSFRGTAVVTAASLYLAVSALLAYIYGVMRYRAVRNTIENTGTGNKKFGADRIGVIMIASLVLIAFVFGVVVIFLRLL